MIDRNGKTILAKKKPQNKHCTKTNQNHGILEVVACFSDNTNKALDV